MGEAKAALATTKYPPEGTRRAGAERANDYLMRFVQYVKVANSQMLAVLMMETPEAVESIEEWVRLPGLDVVHFGPYDLSLRLNVSMDSPVLAAKIEHVEKVCKASGVAMGGAVSSIDEAKEKYTRGYRFFTVPGDMQLLQNGITNFFANASAFSIVKRPARASKQLPPRKHRSNSLTTWEIDAIVVVSVIVFLVILTVLVVVFLRRKRHDTRFTDCSSNTLGDELHTT